MSGRIGRAARGRLSTAAAALTALAALLVLSGCSQTQGAEAGFVSGSGTIVTVPADERAEAPDISGTSLTGKPLSVADHAGQVVVLNVWGSWCGPCRSEAPQLAAAARELAKQDVAFLGINVRDDGQQERALAFVRNFDVPYPSIYDPDGSTLLGLQPKARAIPSTVVLDQQGRVAAVVLGEVRKSTLVGLVEDTTGGGQGSARG